MKVTTSNLVELRDAIYRGDVVEARHLAGDDPVALEYLEGHQVSNYDVVEQLNPKTHPWSSSNHYFGDGYTEVIDIEDDFLTPYPTTIGTGAAFWLDLLPRSGPVIIQFGDGDGSAYRQKGCGVGNAASLAHGTFPDHEDVPF